MGAGAGGGGGGGGGGGPPPPPIDGGGGGGPPTPLVVGGLGGGALLSKGAGGEMFCTLGFALRMFGRCGLRLACLVFPFCVVCRFAVYGLTSTRVARAGA